MMKASLQMIIPVVALFAAVACAAPDKPGDQDDANRRNCRSYERSVGKLLIDSVQADHDAFVWFRKLSRSEQDRLVQELDHYVLILRDEVKPKARKSDGSVAGWQFAGKDVTSVTIKQSGRPERTRRLEVRPLSPSVQIKKADEDDTKEVTLVFDWQAKEGQGLRIDGSTEGCALSWSCFFSYPATPRNEGPGLKRGK